MRKLFKGLCRDDEAYIVVSDRFLTERYSDAVDSRNAQNIVFNLELAAHKSRLAVNDCNSKLGLDYHAFQQLLRHRKAGIRIYLGNVGIIVRAGAAYGERGHIIGDLCKVISAAFESNITGRHLPYNINSHFCGDNDIAAFDPFYFYRSLDTKIKIISGNCKGVSLKFHKDTLKSLNAGFTCCRL